MPKALRVEFEGAVYHITARGNERRPIFRDDTKRQAELDAFPWSSHQDYAGLRSKPLGWLCLDWLAYWGDDPQQARAAYRQRISEAFGKPAVRPWGQLRSGLVLGGDRLLERVRELLQRRGGEEERHWTEAVTTAAVRSAVEKWVANEPDQRVRVWARVRLGGQRPTEVARQMGYGHASSVTMLLKRLEQEATRNEELRQKLETLKASIKSEV